MIQQEWKLFQQFHPLPKNTQPAIFSTLISPIRSKSGKNRTKKMKMLPIASSRVKAPALLAFVMAILALPAGAATVLTVVNHSFETPTRTDGAFSSLGITGWSRAETGGTSHGTYNPVDASFTGSNGSGTPTGADAVHVYTMYVPDLGDYAAAYQTLAATPFVEGTTYTMTVAIGEYKDAVSANWRISLGSSTSPLLTDFASTSGTSANLTDDEFNDFIVSYTATGLETGNLRLTLVGLGTGVGPSVLFDNVRVSSIPEPSTALLGGLGLLLLLRRRNR